MTSPREPYKLEEVTSVVFSQHVLPPGAVGTYAVDPGTEVWADGGGVEFYSGGDFYTAPWTSVAWVYSRGADD